MMDMQLSNQTRCCRCGAIENAYYYIPVLGKIFVCPACHRGWDAWGIQMFMEMIHYESREHSTTT